MGMCPLWKRETTRLKFHDITLYLRLQGGMDKLVCPCCLNILTDLEYITLTNKVCQCHPVTRLNKMEIPI
ncbi:hypothetical protein B188_25590 [Candidatus Brocadiaceae bacterium B188]|nr:hypothetical protein B188_25590 [Candidatus Brocadiaceae bacterium B188]